MKTLIGIFTSEELAIRAIKGLKASGYKDEDISVLTKEQEKQDHIAEKMGEEVLHREEQPDNFASGAKAGGTLGGLGGLLLGLGALTMPGIGAIVAAGPIIGAITGALAGGAVGGLSGALMDAGIPEPEATTYADHIEKGDILVMVAEKDGTKDDVYDHFHKHHGLRGEPHGHDNLDHDEETLKTPPNVENENHVVTEHEQVLSEKDPYRADKPYDLDRKLRDVDEF